MNNNYYQHRDRLNKKRFTRLVQKMQKAKVLDKADEIKVLPSWGKRFRKVVNLKVTAKGQ